MFFLIIINPKGSNSSAIIQNNTLTEKDVMGSLSSKYDEYYPAE